MAYHRNSTNPVAAWCFRWEYKFQHTADWRLDPYSDRYRRHPRLIEAAWGGDALTG